MNNLILEGILFGAAIIGVYIALQAFEFMVMGPV